MVVHETVQNGGVTLRLTKGDAPILKCEFVWESPHVWPGTLHCEGFLDAHRGRLGHARSFAEGAVGARDAAKMAGPAQSLTKGADGAYAFCRRGQDI